MLLDPTNFMGVAIFQTILFHMDDQKKTRKQNNISAQHSNVAELFSSIMCQLGVIILHFTNMKMKKILSNIKFKKLFI